MKKEHRSVKAFKQAFLELLKEQPIDKITVSAIVQRADYTRSAFYARFSSIEEFYQAMVDDEINNYTDIVRSVISQGFELIDGYIVPSFEPLFEYVYSKKELYRFIFTSYNSFNTMERFYSGTIDQSLEYQNEFSDDLPPVDQKLYSYLSSYVQKGAIHFWIESDFRQSPKWMAEQVSLFYNKTVTRPVYKSKM